MGRIAELERRASEGGRRDELASGRDAAAAARDRAAEKREGEMASSLERALVTGHFSVDRVLACVQALRREAAWDRACAADDRHSAAEDRARAAQGRTDGIEALWGAHFDELTGAYRRGLGKHMLRGEIERARRSGSPLAMAIIDVDELKDVNDTKGHLAGDELLRDVVGAIRANIRSYEPIVRLGGDEFAFTIAGLTREGAAERCDLIRAELERSPTRGSFTVGIAELRGDDDLGDLLHRADSALVDSRRTHHRFRSRLSR